MGLMLMLKNILICLCLTLLLSISRPATAQDNLAPQGGRPSDLEGRTWHISSYLDRTRKWPSHGFVRKSEAYLKFEAGTIEGSPGCGRLTGTYSRSDDQLMISAEWSDRKETPCDAEEKKEAREIRDALTHVQRIQVAPSSWHSDVLRLADAEGSTELTLEPMQAGADLLNFKIHFGI
jgi:hypothetical protein